MSNPISPVSAVTQQAQSWSIDSASAPASAVAAGGGQPQISQKEIRKIKAQLDTIQDRTEKMETETGADASDGHDTGAAFQVIILGGGGGPGESDTTGLLVRSTATEWGKSSVMAVDAGVHLSAIDEIFREHLPGAVKVWPPPKRASRLASKLSLPMQPEDPSKPKYYPPVSEARGNSRATSPVDASPPKQMNVLTSGPFNSLMVPYESSAAISAYFLRNLVSTILITHPHLDHLSGFAINTAALQNTTKPKKIVGLPTTIEAIKTHIFNDVIWPNMSDEEGGIGFVSYQRLSEGGHSLLGEHDTAGYIEVCDSLAVKAYLVSHGNCVKRHKHRGSSSIDPGSPGDVTRRSSRFGSISAATGSNTPIQLDHLRGSQRWAGGSNGEGHGHNGWGQRCVVDSSAFFIRDDETSQEVLIFGDVEPDRVSAEPRNHVVWAEAAPKIARRSLTTIFIECSYDDSQSDPMLFGHLAPRHVVAELAMLAAKVTAFRQGILNYAEAQPKDPSDSPHGFTATVTTNTSTSLASSSSPSVAAAARQRHGSMPVPPSSSGGRKRGYESPARNNSITSHDPLAPAGGGNGSSDAAAGNASIKWTASAPAVTASQSKKRNTAATPAAMTTPTRPVPERSTSGVSPLSSPITSEPATSAGVSLFSQHQANNASIMQAPQFQNVMGDARLGGGSSGNINSGDAFAASGGGGVGAMGGVAMGSSVISDVEINLPDGQALPLQGIKVVIIHVKDPLRDDWNPREVILKQLREHEREWGLGCEFVMCKRGDSVWV